MEQKLQPRPQPYAYLLTETDREDIDMLQRTADITRTQATILIALHKYSTGIDKVKSRSIGRPVKVYQVKGDIAEHLRGTIADRLTELNKGAMAVNRIFAQAVPA
jgi:predicted transcriptional regulator